MKNKKKISLLFFFIIFLFNLNYSYAQNNTTNIGPLIFEKNFDLKTLSENNFDLKTLSENEYEISDCGVLNIPDATYYLTTDLIDKRDICFYINANNIKLDCKGHRIDGIQSGTAIYLYNVNNIVINDCIITDWQNAIKCDFSQNNFFENNTLTQNMYGFNLYYCDYSNFINNTITQITNDGVLSWYGDFNLFKNNTITNCNYRAIAMEESDYNLFFDNYALNSNYLFLILSGSDHNYLQNNTAISSLTNCFETKGYNNTIYNNTAIDCWNGIRIVWASYNNITYNYVINNDYGLWFYESYENLIYNNYFENDINVYIERNYNYNYLNTTKQLGTRIYSYGDYIGGNYWSNPNKNGYSDTCEDSDVDGFCDYPLIFTELITDYLPYSNSLMITTTTIPTTTTTTILENEYSIEYCIDTNVLKKIKIINENDMINRYEENIFCNFECNEYLKMCNPEPTIVFFAFVLGFAGMILFIKKL